MATRIIGDVTGYPTLEVNGARYSVRGVGRVGTYTAAKRAGRCRARRYWAIVRWNDATENPALNLAKIGYEEFGEPSFKTKTQAIAYLLGDFRKKIEEA